jgi:hypothetical protein
MPKSRLSACTEDFETENNRVSEIGNKAARNTHASVCMSRAAKKLERSKAQSTEHAHTRGQMEMHMFLPVNAHMP